MKIFKVVKFGEYKIPLIGALTALVIVVIVIIVNVFLTGTKDWASLKSMAWVFAIFAVLVFFLTYLIIYFIRSLKINSLIGTIVILGIIVTLSALKQGTFSHYLLPEIEKLFDISVFSMGITVLALAATLWGIFRVAGEKHTRNEIIDGKRKKTKKEIEKEVKTNIEKEAKYEDSSLLVDEPINHPEQDKLNRIQFSKRIAEVLVGQKGNNCSIVALNGEWGCGKSSILNLVEGILREKKDNSEDIKILRFNPWNASNMEQLTAMFFRELKIALVGEDKNQQNKENIAKLLDIFSGILSVGQLSPVGNQYFTVASTLAEKAGGILKEAPNKTQEEIKEQINKMLKTLAKRIFVIIDDIDRLDCEAMKILFRLIRLNANFENITYLLAFDRNLVEVVLNDEQSGHGKEYLDKIIQVPINIPSPDDTIMTTILLDGVAKLINKWGEEGFDQRQWERLGTAGHFTKYFKNVRDIVRYLNGLEVTYPIVSSEVNMVDFIGLNLIRTFAPISYEMIRKNKDLLVKQDNELMKDVSYVKNANAALNRIFGFPKEDTYDGRSEELADCVRGTCRVLFPKVLNIEGNYREDINEKDWAKNKRICSWEYFDKYFILGTPINDISDLEMKSFIGIVGDSEKFTKKIEEFYDRKLGRRMLGKMEEYIDAIGENDYEQAIVGIYNAEEKILSEKREMLKMDSSLFAARIVYLILEKISIDTRTQVIINTIEKSKKLVIPVEFVSLITPDKRGNEAEKQKDILGLSGKDLEEIHKKCVEKIKSFVGKEELTEIPRLGEILYRWKDWGDEEDVKDFVNRLIKTDIGLWTFLLGLTNEVLSTAGNYKTINKKHTSDFTDFSDLDNRVKKIIDTKGNYLTDQQKEIIQAFENGKKKDLNF